MVFGEQRIDDLRPQGIQAFERSGLVSRYEAAVADDICCQDSSQTTLNPTL